MVFARDVASHQLTFGVSGKLIMNALVMYDHQTDSLWSQFLGEAVKGPLSGTKLTLLAAQMTSWGAWKEAHRDTTALAKSGFDGSDSYAGYYRGGSAGILGEANDDRRLATKELVVGLVEEDGQRAYSLGDLKLAPVLNDSFLGRPIVVTMLPGSTSAAVFDRRLDGRTLFFEESPAQGEGPKLMSDQETGSTWRVTTGEAVAGPLAGRRLTRLPSHVSFWFAWTDFYPNTELYRR